VVTLQRAEARLDLDLIVHEREEAIEVTAVEELIHEQGQILILACPSTLSRHTTTGKRTSVSCGWPCGQNAHPSPDATDGATSATRREAGVTGFDCGAGAALLRRKPTGPVACRNADAGLAPCFCVEADGEVEELGEQ